MTRSFTTLVLMAALAACDSATAPEPPRFACQASSVGLEGWFNDVWVFAADDAYAVGVEVYERTGVVMHWDGAAWSRVREVPDMELRGIWASGPDDIHVVGNDWGTRHLGLILDWDGTAWAETQVPWMLMLDVAGTSAGEIYAVGIDAQFEGPPIYAFDGTRWSRLGAEIYPIIISAIRPFPGSLMGVGGGGLMAFNGTSWAALALPALEENHAIEWRGLWGATPDGVVLTGAEYDYTPGAYRVSGVILRRTPDGWMRNELAYPMRSVWGDGGGGLVAVGENGSVVRWDGGAWSFVETAVDAPLWGVHGADMTAALAVGGHFSPTLDTYEAVALHCGRGG